MSGFLSNTRWQPPSVKATLNPRVGIKDAGRVISGKPREGTDPLGIAPDKKAPPAIPPPPIIEDTDGRAQDESDRIRNRRGRASAILSQRSAPAPQTASKVLLGA